jgi:isopentenyl-diphosphate delta-isomerase
MARTGGKKPLSPTQRRKQEHLELCLDPSVEGSGTGFDRYAFVHNALPETDLDEIDLSTTFLGKRLNAPVLISSMTGGFELARKINRNLATAAQRLGLAMGVGSQRVALELPEAADSFQIRDLAPDILLLGNLGAVQLNYGYGVAECRRAVDMIGADALILHLNVLQEAAQPEGNRNFKGLHRRIAEVCAKLGAPVVAKEIGFGISADAARRLKSAGVSAIDVAGKPVGGAFADWGIPTEEALVQVRAALPDIELVASGGIRNGLDIAKAIALGANVAALGQPLLAPALESADKVVESLASLIGEIKVAMLCVGARDLAALRQAPLVRRT